MIEPLGSASEDQSAQAVYARMLHHGETFAQAVAAVALPGTEVPQVRRRLSELGLLDATAEIAVDAAAALTRILGEGRDRLSETLAALLDRQQLALSVASDYVRLAAKARASSVEVLPRDDTFRPRMESLLDYAAESSRRELVAMHPHAIWDERYFEDGLRRTK